MSSKHYERKMYYGAPAFTHGIAKHLRKNQTKAEAVLWEELRKNPWGFKFRRQHPVAIFIADFYCHRAKLIIEIDGSIHDQESTKLNDEEREWNLKLMGLTVIRFQNDQVLNHLDNVLDTIRLHVEPHRQVP